MMKRNSIDEAVKPTLLGEKNYGENPIEDEEKSNI